MQLYRGLILTIGLLSRSVLFNLRLSTSVKGRIINNSLKSRITNWPLINYVRIAQQINRRSSPLSQCQIVLGEQKWKRDIVTAPGRYPSPPRDLRSEPPVAPSTRLVQSLQWKSVFLTPIHSLKLNVILPAINT